MLSQKISVVIPVFNAEPYIEKAVQSALDQPETGEIILIEDGSKDSSLKICQRLATTSDRIKLLTHSGRPNKGAGASRNLGIKHAQCPYIAFLDADDYYLPDRFRAERKIFEENPAADGVYGAIGTHFYSEAAKEQFKKTLNREWTTINKILPPDQLIFSLLGLIPYGYFHLDALTVKREIFLDRVLCFNEGLRLHQDTELLIKMSYHLKLFPGSIDQAVAMRGVHETNRITSSSSQIAKLRNRYKMWKSLHQWCKTTAINNDKIKSEIRLQYYAHSITQKKGISQWIRWIKKSAKDKRLVTDERYFYIYSSHLFGNGFFKRIVHKLTHKLR